MDTRHYPYMTEVMHELMLRAKSRGLDVTIESSTGMAITIKKPAITRVIMGADLGVNASAAGRLCNDKYFAADILQQAGLNVIDSLIIDSSGTHPLPLDKIEFPCIVKPNKGAGGDGFSQLESRADLQRAIEFAQRFDTHVLIQKRCIQREFRVVVLDGELLYAYEKTAWRICGDGKTDIAGFVSLYNARVSERQRISANDAALKANLLNAGKTLSTVLHPGETFNMFANANLKKGASCSSVNALAPEYINIVVSACSALGLRYAGVDLFAEQPDFFDSNYHIIEVNSNPGFEFLRRDRALMRTVLDKLASTLFDC